MTKLLDYLLLILSGAYFVLFYFAKDLPLVQKYLTNEIYANTVSTINAVLAVLSVFAVLSLVQIYTKKFCDKVTAKIPGQIDEILFNFLIKSISISKYVISAYVAYRILEVPASFDVILDKIFDVSFIFIWIILWTSLINEIFKVYVLKLWELHTLAKQLLPFLNKVIIIFVWILWIITILSNLGYNVSALIAWAWIWGLAFALAAQKSVANIFGAITIILNKPFKVGDFINISGFDGTVKDIGITYLTLVDKWGHNIYVPNDGIVSNAIQNYSERESRRADFSIGLVYDTTLEKMKEGVQIIETILQKHVDESSLTKYRVNFDNFGDFSLNINATYFTSELSLNPFLKEKELINIEIKEAFAKASIEMAFPTQEVIVKK